MLELFATALLGIAAFIALQVWEMKALLTRTTTRLDGHERRITKLEGEYSQL